MVFPKGVATTSHPSALPRTNTANNNGLPNHPDRRQCVKCRSWHWKSQQCQRCRGVNTTNQGPPTAPRTNAPRPSFKPRANELMHEVVEELADVADEVCEDVDAEWVDREDE